MESPSWMGTEGEKGLSEGVQGRGRPPPARPGSWGLSSPGFHRRGGKETWARVPASPEQGCGALSGCQSL